MAVLKIPGKSSVTNYNLTLSKLTYALAITYNLTHFSSKREPPLSAVSTLHAGVQRKCRQEARNRFNYVQRHHTPDQRAAVTGIWGHGTNTATSRPRNLSQENIRLYIQSGEIQIYSFFYWQFWKCIICVLYTSHKNINQLRLE